MTEPIPLLAAALSGAFIVLSGAGYALLFAVARLFEKPGLMPAAYGCYLVLVGCAVVLAGTLSLAGAWWLLVALMLVGYLFAPHAIWHLSVATHADIQSGKPTREKSYE